MNHPEAGKQIISDDLKAVEERLVSKLDSAKQELTEKLASKKELQAAEQKLVSKLDAAKQELTEKLASKEELQAVEQKLVSKLDSAKQELTEKLASKEELQAVEQKLVSKLDSAKQELTEKLASKEELQAVRQNLTDLSKQVSLNRFDIRGLKIDVKNLGANMSEKFDRVFVVLDNIVGKLNDISTEKIATDHTLRGHGGRLDNLEVRMKTVERKVG